MVKNNHDDYEIVPFPTARRVIVDYLHASARKHTIHGLIEVDVTDARQYMREHKARTGESLSFTAFVITCLGQAIGEHKYVHAYRNWRNQLVMFDEVDVNTMVERDVRGRQMGTVYIVRAANKKTFHEIHQEIRAAQKQETEETVEFKAWWYLYFILPVFVRSLFWRFLTKFPHLVKKMIGTVSVTAVGMFGKGSGWGITIPFHTFQMTIGGIARKPGVVDGRIEPREYLSLTLSFDHDIVDGAPATRFSKRLLELIENGYVLDGWSSQLEQH